VDSRTTIFILLLLRHDGQRFTIYDKLRIVSTPDNIKCTDTNEEALVCCDNTTINSSEVLQMPLTIGVLGRSRARVLALPVDDADSIYKDRLRNSRNIGDSFTLESRSSQTLPMMRLSITPDLAGVETSPEITSTAAVDNDDFATSGKSLCS
jgi:hypothetical protein